MPISSVTPGLPSPLLDALKRNQATQRSAGLGVQEPSAGTQVSFSNALQQALQSVSSAQNQAGELAEAFQADPTKVGLEDAMVAMQKSQIGFQSALHVRNRLVSAYSDIMNMQV